MKLIKTNTSVKKLFPARGWKNSSQPTLTARNFSSHLSGNSVKAAAVYTGIIMGAGFASGQELVAFFAGHGYAGILGVVLSSAILGLTGWAVMDICVRHKVKSSNEFSKLVFGKYLSKIIEAIVFIFVTVLFCTMLAGAGAAAKQSGLTSFSVGAAFMALCCFVTFLFDLKGIIGISVVLSPIMVIGSVFLGIYTLIFRNVPPSGGDIPVFNAFFSGWAFSAALYASYNIITAVSVLAGMSGTVNTPKTARSAGIIGGLCVCAIGIAFTLPLIINLQYVQMLEIPMLEIVNNHGSILYGLYLFVLFAAIFTTAVANGFILIDKLSGMLKIPRFCVKLLCSLAAFFIAHVGFSNFVGRVYPLFGYVGLFQAVAIILFFIFGRKKTEDVSDTKKLKNRLVAGIWARRVQKR